MRPIQMGLPVSRFSYSSIFAGKIVRNARTRSNEAERRLQRDAADAEVAGHHALAGDGLEDAQQLFALAEAVEEDGERADVHGVRAEPDEVRVEARQLVEQHAEPLRALGDLESEQLLDRQAVGQVVGHRAEIVDAVGERDDLLVELGLAGLLDAGVQIADVGRERDDGLAVDLEHQAQNAVRGRVLRAHVEDHGVLAGGGGVAVLGVGDDVFDAGMIMSGAATGAIRFPSLNSFRFTPTSQNRDVGHPNYR